MKKKPWSTHIQYIATTYISHSCFGIKMNPLIHYFHCKDLIYISGSPEKMGCQSTRFDSKAGVYLLQQKLLALLDNTKIAKSFLVDCLIVSCSMYIQSTIDIYLLYK